MQQNQNSQKIESEVLLAIATALHFERSFPEGIERLTISHDARSEWGYTGKLQRLSSRKNIHIRSRK